MSQDPLGYADNVNLYAYVANAPLNYYDPSGLMMDTMGLSNENWDLIPSDRLPDYVTMQIDGYVASASATFTRDGDVFAAFGVSRQYPDPTNVGANISDGYVLKSNPSRNDVNNFLDGYAASAGYYRGVGGAVVVNGSGKAINIGVGAGGGGVSPGAVNTYRGNVFGDSWK